MTKGSIRILVEKVHVEGEGAILLTGPSGCGKGEIAKALRRFLSIPEDRHLSMGDILRRTIDMADRDPDFRLMLKTNYGISDSVSVLDPLQNRSEITTKANAFKEEMKNCFGSETNHPSQLDWLKFCVANGLLVPDEWTEKMVEALFRNWHVSHEMKKGIFILDGYPRTVRAAEHLMNTFDSMGIPVIKILHLFITKEQMNSRAFGRKRNDDTGDSLERRYQFYIDRVQPCIDYMKLQLGNNMVALIDAHQPVYENGEMDVEASINKVVAGVMQALGLPGYLLDLK